MRVYPAVFILFMTSACLFAQTKSPSPKPTDDTAEKKKSAGEVFDTLVKKGRPGMTLSEAETYLRKYDPKYTDPEYVAFAKDNPAFKRLMEAKIEKDAKGLLSNEGVLISGERVITRATFVEDAPTFNPTLGKEPKTDYLASVTNKVLTDESLSITKSTTIQGDEKRPAQFGYLLDKGRSVFTIDGALSYKFNRQAPFGGDDFSFLPIITPTLEAHTSTRAKKQQDSLSAKVVAEFDIASSFMPDLFQEHTITITPSYETDHLKKTEAYSINVMYSPTLGGWFPTGKFIPLAQILNGVGISGYQHEYPGIIWRPYVGFEDGLISTPSNDTSVYGGEDTYSRFASVLHSDLYLAPRFDVAVDFSNRTFFTGTDRTFDYVEVSPILYLDGNPADPTTEHFSLGMSLKYGKTTPQFKNVDSLSAWLGVRF